MTLYGKGLNVIISKSLLQVKKNDVIKNVILTVDRMIMLKAKLSLFIVPQLFGA